MRHLEDAIHQMNGRVQGNQGHNGNNVNNVNNVNINNEVGINELIRLHRSSSSNRNVSVKGTHRPKTHKNVIGRMIDNPFWKVFFKKQKSGYHIFTEKCAKNNKKVKGHVYAFPVVYTTVKLVQQLQIIFRLVLCIAHRCDCNKRNKDPVCTYCIRCKHTNDHRISGFDCNQMHIDVQNRQKMRGKCNKHVIRHKEDAPLKYLHGLVISRLNTDADASMQTVFATMMNNYGNDQWLLIEHDPAIQVHGPVCAIKGKHYHVVWASDTYWDNCHRTKTFKATLGTNAMRVKMTSIRDPEAFATYLRLPGRELIHSNLPDDTSYIHPIFEYYKQATETAIQAMNDKKIKERGSTLDVDQVPFGKKFDTDFLQSLVTKYSGLSVNQLVDKVFRYEGNDVKARFERIYYKSTFMNLYQKVKTRITISQLDRTLSELTVDWAVLFDNMDEVERGDYLSVKESDDLLRDWCLFQGIDAFALATHVELIMNKAVAKVNTLILEGESNAGKTWLANSLQALAGNVGEITQGTQGYAFMWMDCVDRRLIIMNEPYVDNCVIEKTKIILEGQPTPVAVKHQAEAHLRRTPVIVTCNKPLWRFAQSEQTAIENRSYQYRGLRKCALLKNITKRLSPLVWQSILDDETAAFKESSFHYDDVQEQMLAVDDSPTSPISIDSDSTITQLCTQLDTTHVTLHKSVIDEQNDIANDTVFTNAGRKRKIMRQKPHP